MSIGFAEVEQLAKQLPPEERAQLVDSLLVSLQEPPLADIEAAWEQEIIRRVEAFERGETESIPAEEVLAEIRRITG